MSATENELRQLRARIRTLEDELGSERRGRRYEWDRQADRVTDDWSNLTNRKIDEISRLFTGTIRATLEGIRVAADSASYFVEDVLERSVPERSESPTEAVRRLPADITSGVARSLNRKLEIPSRSIESFRATYQEEGGRRRRRTRQRTAAPPDNYESSTKQELYERATELGIEGRSEMTKQELIEAIRSAEKEVDLEDMSKAGLYQMARDLDIEGRSEMTREELIEAIRARREEVAA